MLSTKVAHALTALIALFLTACWAACSKLPASATAAGPALAARQQPVISLEEFKAKILEAELFSGGPDERYGEMGRDSLSTSIKVGLMPHHKVLDIGAGSLRVAWWFLHFVEPSNYHAIEPVQSRVDKAQEILGVRIHKYYNDDFEFPNVRFDFVFARSIWTHASKKMISKMLAEFVENAAPDATFLTSYIPAQSEQEDYIGDEWAGRIKEDDEGGTIRHSREWLERECDQHGLSVTPGATLFGQEWLVIRRRG